MQPELMRRPCSALIEHRTTRILLDAGLPDLHERFAPGQLSAILLTHYHPDHVQGLFHLRWGMGATIPVYGPHDPAGCADLLTNHGLLEFNRLDSLVPLTIGTLRITPLSLHHSRPTLGYAVESLDGARFAYLTDTAGLPSLCEHFLMSWNDFDLALDCSYVQGTLSANHNDFNTALSIVATVKPVHAWLTHISHQVDEWRMTTPVRLPPRLHWAADGLKADIAVPLTTR